MMRYDDPNVPLSAVIGLIAVILVFVIIVALQAVFYNMQAAELERKVGSPRDQELAQLEASQREILTTYRWIDQKGGVVGIPIERAMELVAAEAQGE
jgi:hypothetical protein